MMEDSRPRNGDRRSSPDRRQKDITATVDRRVPPNRRKWTGRRAGIDKGTFELEDKSRPIFQLGSRARTKPHIRNLTPLLFAGRKPYRPLFCRRELCWHLLSCRQLHPNSGIRGLQRLADVLLQVIQARLQVAERAGLLHRNPDPWPFGTVAIGEIRAQRPVGGLYSRLDDQQHYPDGPGVVRCDQVGNVG